MKWKRDTESAVEQGKYAYDKPGSKNTLAELIDRYIEKERKFKQKGQAFISEFLEPHGANITEKMSKNLVIIHEVLDKENVDISSVSYDGTNFYTFIDTFNTRCSLAKRGKNKQGRSNLRQVSYVLFCSADGHIPLHYEIYDGNRNDVQNFPNALEGFKQLFEKKITSELLQKMTLVFDKGNNAPDNFEMIDTMQLHFLKK